MLGLPHPDTDYRYRLQKSIRRIGDSCQDNCGLDCSGCQSRRSYLQKYIPHYHGVLNYQVADPMSDEPTTLSRRLTGLSMLNSERSHR